MFGSVVTFVRVVPVPPFFVVDPSHHTHLFFFLRQGLVDHPRADRHHPTLVAADDIETRKSLTVGFYLFFPCGNNMGK